MPAIALKLFAHSFQVVVGKFLSEKSFSSLETWRRAEDHHHRAPLRDNHSSTAPPIQTFKKKIFRFFSFETMIGFVSKNCWHKAKDITHSSSSLGLLSFEALLNKNILIFCLKNAPKMSFLRAAKCSCRRRQKIKRSQLRFFAAKNYFLKTIFIILTFLTLTYVRKIFFLRVPYSGKWQRHENFRSLDDLVSIRFGLRVLLPQNLASEWLH